MASQSYFWQRFHEAGSQAKVLTPESADRNEELYRLKAGTYVSEVMCFLGISGYAPGKISRRDHRQGAMSQCLLRIA